MGKDGRGLDHLMEQNETELDFLSAYGGVDDGKKGDGHALLSALQRFLRAGGLEPDLNESTLNLPGVPPGSRTTDAVWSCPESTFRWWTATSWSPVFPTATSTLNAVKSACC